MFGCNTYSVDYKTKDKINPRSWKEIFVEYEKNKNQYRIYNPTTNKIQIKRNVVFNEESMQDDPINWNQWEFIKDDNDIPEYIYVDVLNDV